jgi:hypothetical protein
MLGSRFQLAFNRADTDATEQGAIVKKTFIGAALIAALASLPAAAQVALGTAQNFSVLAGQAITNTGPTVITGNVGVSPLTAVTGFPPGVVVGGTIHAADFAADQAQTDLANAYSTASLTPCNVDLTGQNLGGKILTPGTYCFSSSAALTGTLTLNFQGNPNNAFLFKIGSTLTTASASSVVLINTTGTTCPPNVNWLVGSSATLGTGSSIAGNILTLASATLTTGAQTTGRVLAGRLGAVTLDTNTIGSCAPLQVPAPVGTAVPAMSHLTLIALLICLAIAGVFVTRNLTS